MATTTLDNGNIKLYDAKTEELVSPVFKVLCYGIVLLGVLSLITLSVFGLIFGIIFLATALFFLTTTKRITIDFENSVYREYSSTFGIKVGEWKTLFDCKTITITSSGKMFINNVTMGGAQTYSHSGKVKKTTIRRL